MLALFVLQYFSLKALQTHDHKLYVCIEDGVYGLPQAISHDVANHTLKQKQRIIYQLPLKHLYSYQVHGS